MIQDCITLNANSVVIPHNARSSSSPEHAVTAALLSSNRFKVCALADNRGPGSGRISSAAILLALLRSGSHFGNLLVVH